MMVYAFFFIALSIGAMLLMYGLYMDIMFYAQITTILGMKQLVIPLGFYVVICAAFVLIGVPIFIMIRIKLSGCGKRFDHVPKGKGLFDFIYRDGEIRDTWGDRIPGLGLFRILKLGLIFDMGRDPRPGSIYNLPGKKLRFCLQDINYNQNVKMTGFYTYLTGLGFNNGTELREVLNGYNPELMVNIWNRMVDAPLKRSVDVIVERMQTLEKTDIDLMDKQWKQELKKTRFFKKQKKELKEQKKQETGKQPSTPFGIVKQALDQKNESVENNVDKILGGKKP